MATEEKRDVKQEIKDNAPAAPADASSAAASKRIVIGWQVDRLFHPTYWLGENPKPGQQSDSSLTSIDAKEIDRHMIILAASGSGKSYLLGGLIEEIVCKTGSCCTIFDPNADFRQIDKVVEGCWEPRQKPPKKKDPGWGYHPESRMGFLPYDTKDEFNQAWSSKTFKTLSMLKGNTLKFDWSDLPSEWLFGAGWDEKERAELEAIHRIFQRYDEFIDRQYACALSARADVSKLEERDLLGDVRQLLEAQMSTRVTIANFARVDLKLLDGIDESMRSDEKDAYARLCQALHGRNTFNPSLLEYYIELYRKLKDDGLLAGLKDSDRGSRFGVSARVRVVDLASMDSPVRELAVWVTLDYLWKKRKKELDEWLDLKASKPDATDTRVPHFVVIDEAHNLVAADADEPIRRRIIDQVCRIAAEGRKYGLFLMLVSQRPDKIHPRVLSEAENKVIMRMGSRSVLDATRAMLGLDDVRDGDLDDALKLPKGRGILAGSWVKEPVFFMAARRRTEEGGASLDPDYWTRTNLPVP